MHFLTSKLIKDVLAECPHPEGQVLEQIFWFVPGLIPDVFYLSQREVWESEC